MKKILLFLSGAESEKTVSLLKGKYEYRNVASVKDAGGTISAFSPDAAIISESFCGYGQTELCSLIKEKAKIPVIVERDLEKKRTKEYLSSGCDDFIALPVRENELYERIEIMTGRSKSGGNVFVSGKLTVDYDLCRVTVAGQPVRLTLIEYKLLCLLSKNSGKVMTYKAIVDELWQSSIGNEITSLRVFASTLRKKLSLASGGESYIETHMGIGYCLRADKENGEI